ncbi:hypothetical protein Csa_010596 [Cucumis sativus]|nr:hypothetical protein Csa_010596 [Cucumis sativus]
MSFQDIEAGRPFASSRRDLINGKQDPTQAVASGIFQINTAVATFQRLVNTLGTPKDTPELREKLRNFCSSRRSAWEIYMVWTGPSCPWGKGILFLHFNAVPVSRALSVCLSAVLLGAVLEDNRNYLRYCQSTRLVSSSGLKPLGLRDENNDVGKKLFDFFLCTLGEIPLGFERHKTRLHIGQLVKDTSAKLKQASDIDHHAEVNASKKIADAKLAKDFQAVLKEFQKAQRLAAERETAYSPFVPPTVLPSSYTAWEADASSEKNLEQRALLVESRRQEVLLLDNEIAFNEAIIEEREQGIHEIQQQIGEVNEIFKDLAVLVHEQGAMIDDIGSNIEGAHAATSQGTTQLVKASKTQRSNSSLCLCIASPGLLADGTKSSFSSDVRIRIGGQKLIGG